MNIIMNYLDATTEHDDSDEGPYYKELSHDEVCMINYLRSSATPANTLNKTLDPIGAQLSHKLISGNAQVSILRRIGLSPSVSITNLSGYNAWVILSPAPITSLSSVGIEKIGQVSFSSSGEYKCQQSSLLNYSCREFELDNNEIYYTVFFNCDGKWKTPFKNRKINTRKYNINLLKKHIEESIDCDFVPN